MKLNKDQRDVTSKTLLDIGKIVLTTFVVGGLIPNSPIGIPHIVAAIIISIILYIASTRISQGSQNVIARSGATKQSLHEKIASLSLAMTGLVMIVKGPCEIRVR